MKYAIFSDIHGNYLAFEAMLNEISLYTIDAFVCCGDIVGYYYDSSLIVERLMTMPNAYVVKGNHDAMYMQAAEDQKLQEILCRKYGSSYQYIRDDIYAYLSTLPFKISLNVDGQRILVVHGSEQDALHGRIYPDSQLNLSSEYDVIFCGHTHYPMIRKFGKTTLINPGSLGQPRDGTGFSYGIYDTFLRTWERHTTDICIEPLLRQIERNDTGLPYLKSVLFRGVNQCYETDTHHSGRG